MCLITFVIVCGFTAFCIGKYTQYVTIKVRTDIANPKFSVEFNEPIEVSGEDTEKTYIFTVKNYETDEKNNKNISEVDLDYYIQIISDIDNGVKYELYKNNELVAINDELRTNYIRMDSDNLNEHNYLLKVFNEITNNTEDIDKQTKIKVYCKQINIL